MDPPAAGRRCTRGGAGWVVPGEDYTGYYPPVDPQAGLTLIYGILMENRFILPFDWNILRYTEIY